MCCLDSDTQDSNQGAVGKRKQKTLPAERERVAMKFCSGKNCRNHHWSLPFRRFPIWSAV